MQKSSTPRPERRELGGAVLDGLGREGMWCGMGFGHRPAVLKAAGLSYCTLP